MVVYQGSLLLDSALASLSYRVFGVTLLSWHAVGMLWAAGLAVVGARVLRRAVGWGGAVAWVLLLTASPFLLKDGLLAIIGGHAVAPFWGFAALLAAMGGRRGRPLLAGLLLSLGAWYVRSAIVALPAVAMVARGAGTRGLRRLGLGMILLPALLLLNAWGVATATTTFQGQLGRALHTVTLGFRPSEPTPVATAEKLAEATGRRVESLLFAEPAAGGDAADAQLDGRGLAARAWTVAWSAVLPVALLTAWLSRCRGTLLPGAVPAALLALSFPLAFMLGPFALDPSMLELARTGSAGALAPGINAPRYLVPVGLGWTFLLAWTLGQLGHGLGRWRLAVLGLLALVGPGLVLAVEDVARREPGAQAVVEGAPYYYPGLLLPGRLPPLSLHLAADRSQRDSREFHLTAIGMLLSDSLPGGFAAASEALAGVTTEMDLRPKEVRQLAYGLGEALGLKAQDGPAEQQRVKWRGIRQGADGMTARARRSFVRAVSRSLSRRAVQEDPRFYLEVLCLDAPRQTELCERGARELVVRERTPGAPLPSSPDPLFPPGMLAQVPPDVRGALLRAAGQVLSRERADALRRVEATAGWDEGDAARLREGAGGS